MVFREFLRYRKLLRNQISDKILELEKERKIKMMLEAASDPEYLARCKEIQDDYRHIDYFGGKEEW